jgi:hypothetical protein
MDIGDMLVVVPTPPSKVSSEPVPANNCRLEVNDRRSPWCARELFDILEGDFIEVPEDEGERRESCLLLLEYGGMDRRIFTRFWFVF